jgi:hypothetical protein
MTTWVLLIYKVPREPSARRVYVWRKLKQLGAVALQDAIWILPSTPWTREQFQWLAAEIGELGGEAWFWEGQLLPPSQDAALIAQFGAQIAGLYREILAALTAPDPDLPALARRFQQAQAQDYFTSALREEVRAALLAAQEGSER